MKANEFFFSSVSIEEIAIKHALDGRPGAGVRMDCEREAAPR